MSKDKPKNWWDADETVTTAKPVTNWWDEDHPADPANGAGISSVNPMAQMGQRAQAVSPVAPQAPATIRPQDWSNPPTDPLMPSDPTQRAAYIDRQNRAKGLIPMTTDNGTEWIPDPSKQSATRGLTTQYPDAMANKASADLNREHAKIPFIGFSDALKNNVFAPVEGAIGGTLNAGLDVVDKDRNISKAISENVTPAAQALGEAVEGPNGRFGGMVPAITGGLAEWGATTARDPLQGATEANEALNPFIPLSEGYNQIVDASGDLIDGVQSDTGQKFVQGSMNLGIGAMGIVPQGSMTVSAMAQKFAARRLEQEAQISRVASNVKPIGTGMGGGPPVIPPGATPPLVPPVDPLPSLDKATRRAADLMLRKLAADGITIDDIAKTAAALGRKGDSGVYETIGEIAGLTGKSSGANVRGLQMAGGSVPGPLQEALVGQVNANTKAMPQRVSRSATRATGQSADAAVDTLQALDRRLKTESGPKYEAFFSSPVRNDTFTREILPILNTEAGQVAAKQALAAVVQKEARLRARVAGGKATATQARELEHATGAIRSLEAYIADPVMGTAIPSPYAMDRIKRAFDNQIEAAGHGSEIARDIRGTKADFAEAVSHATGGTYGEALGFYEGQKRLRDAFDFGTAALNKRTWQLKEEMATGLKGRAWSSGEIEAVAMGVARNIEDLIEANEQSALTRLMKGKALENLSTSLGSEKAAKLFEESIRRIAANREWGRRVAGGSDTAMRQAAIRDASVEGEDAITRALDKAETGQAPPTAFSAAWDALGKPAVRVAKDAYQHIRYPGIYNTDVNAALAPMLGRPMTKGNLESIAATLKAREAEKAKGILGMGKTVATPTAPAATKSAPKKPLPGQTSKASPTVTGALVGGTAGYVASDGDPRATAAGALGGGLVGNRLAKFGGGRKPPAPPKPPVQKAQVAAGGMLADGRPAPRETFRVNSDGTRESVGTLGPDRRGEFTLSNGKEFRLTFKKEDGSVQVDFREKDQPGKFKPTGTGSLSEANEVFAKVNAAIVDDIDQHARATYTLMGETEQQRRIYAQLAQRTEPPAGYRWEGPNSNGGVSLVREVLAPKPPTRQGFGSSKLPMDEGRGQNYIDQAVEHFGLTDDLREAGYMLPDGRMLDLSGRHEMLGGDYVRQDGLNVATGRDWQAGKRHTDHRELPFDVQEAKANEANFGNTSTAHMLGFQKETGAIRIMPGTGISVSVMPSDKQIKALVTRWRRTYGNDAMLIDVDDAVTGKTISSIDVQRVTVEDVKNALQQAPSPPSQSGSSKLLAGMGENGTGYGVAGGAVAGGAFAPDTNKDGKVDATERMAGAMGGAVTGGVLGYGASKLAGNRLGAGMRAKGQPRFRAPDAQTFGGVNAKTADRAALGRAQNMEAEGADRNAIWDATGWFKGVDGKWRFEIDDSGAKIGSEAALVFNGGRPYPSTMQNVMEHPELYAAYPDMATDAGMIARRSREAGVYEPELKSATAIAPDLENARSIMLHEAGGHGVQEREGFARGGTPENSWGTREQPLLDAVRAAKKEALGGRDPYQIQNQIASGYYVPKEDLAALERWRKLTEQEDEILSGTLSGREAYQRLAGETEARNVQTRRDFTPEERRARRPWETQDVPDDQQIVRFGSGKAESRPPGFGAGRKATPPNKLSGPPKPGSGVLGNVAKRAAVGAVTGAAINLATSAGAQEDLSGKIGTTEQSIATLKQKLADLDKITDPRVKQQFLKDAGFYDGKIDGNIAGKTTEGMERFRAKQEADMAKAEAELVELVRRNAYQKNQPNPYMAAIRDYTPTIAGFAVLLGLKYLRGRAAKDSISIAEAGAKKLDRYVTPIKKEPVTSMVNKAGTSRPANLNTFWQKGGASKDELPFKQDSAGNWKPNTKAKPADELFKANGYWQSITRTVSKYVSGKDLSLIIAGGTDAVAIQPMIDEAHRKQREAEEDWKNNPSDETFKRVEDAKNEVMAYTLVQRLGQGLAVGRIIGSVGKEYTSPKPNIPAAATEQAAIKQYIVASKPPPKPRITAGATLGTTVATAPKPPTKPRPVKNPKQLPLPFGGGTTGRKKP